MAEEKKEMSEQSQRRQRQGIVRKNAMDKTVVVEVSRLYRHRKYQKLVRDRERYNAHDAENTCNIGDVVQLEESRPLSKSKRWVVTKVIERAV